ncbi:condensation domain-containing protein, partial [Mesorhizobium sp. M0955]
MSMRETGTESNRATMQGEAQRHALIADFLKARKKEDAGIPRRQGDRPSRLSFAQERLWFLDKLVPGNPFYSESAVFELTGQFNLGVLERALNRIIERHEALRTVFRDIDGRGHQVVLPEMKVPLPVIDLQMLPLRDRVRHAIRLSEEEARRPFDLQCGPLLRVTMLQIDKQKFLCLLSIHHIVCDGWSMKIFVRELSQFYAAIAEGKAPAMPPLKVQYADFAAWQRQQHSLATMLTHAEYWRRTLDGVALLNLPGDRPRPAVFSYRGAVLDAALPGEVSERLAELAREENASLFMVLLAAFQALLFRICGTDDVAVGVPVANRNHPETEPLIGFFVNTLVMRGRPAAGMTFREYLRQVRRTAMEAYEHQDIPFEKIVEMLQPSRDLSVNPLVNVIFQIDHDEGRKITSSGALELAEFTSGTAKFDLRIDHLVSGGQIRTRLEYATDLFDASTAGRIMRWYETLLADVAADPARQLGAIAYETGTEVNRLLDLSGSTNTEPSNRTIIECFAETSAEHASEVAVESQDGRERITYAELDGRSAAMAARLVALGVKLDDRVALAMDRGPDVVVAMLAVLKAGAAYLPLDPSYPAERLRMMIRDGGARVVIADGRNPDLLTEDDIEVLEPDDASARQGPRLPAAARRPDRLAYVMFTSGSTGRPKGIAVTHEGVVRLVRGTDYARYAPDETFLQVAPLAFDAATLEIWGPLLNGGRLVMFRDARPDLDELEQVLRDRKVTTLWITSGLFRQLVEVRPDALLLLRQLMTGGDVVSIPHVREALRRAPRLRLIHAYGPTENTTFTTCRRVAAGDLAGATIPIGRAILGSYVRVLDPWLGLCPVG